MQIFGIQTTKTKNADCALSSMQVSSKAVPVLYDQRAEVLSEIKGSRTKMEPNAVAVLAFVVCLIPGSFCLLRNCVTPEEWKKDHITPKCEVVTIYDFDCLAKNQISVRRPQKGPTVKPDQTLIVCRAPYPIDVDVEGTKIKGFPGIFFTRKSLDNSAELTAASQFEYTITVPLVFSQYFPRWWKIFRVSDSTVRTEFYLYSPGPGDKVLPSDWQNEKQEEFIVVPETRFVVLPCVVTHPKDPVTLFKHGATGRIEIPVDNTTVKFDPSVGFTLDTNVDPPMFGNYWCQSLNPRTKNLQKFDITLDKNADFVVTPSVEVVRSFTDRELILTCKSKIPIFMSGTLNSTEIPKSHFKLVQNDTLILKYIGIYNVEAGKLEPSDSLIVTCGNQITLNLQSRDSEGSTHTWRVQVLDIEQNDILQVTNDGTRVTCSSNLGPVFFYNAECINLAHCRSRESAFKLFGLGQCGIRIDVVRCGTPCGGTDSSNCLQMLETATYSRGHFKCEGADLMYEFNFIDGYDNHTYSDLDNIPPEALIEITMPTTSILVNVTYKFRCRASSFLSNGEFIWKARRLDGSMFSPKIEAARAFHDYESNADSIWEADIRFEDLATEILCFVPKWNSDTWVNISVPIENRKPTQPLITNKGENQRLETGKDGQTLICHAQGDPYPDLKWYRNGELVRAPFLAYRSPEGEVLEFPVMTPELAGIYQCKAKSIGGEDAGEFKVEAYDPPNITIYIVLGITLLILLIIILLVLYWKLRRAKQAIKYLSDAEVNFFKYGNPEVAKSAKDPHERIVNLPFNPEYEIAKDRLEFNETNVLGSGAFGVVYKGKLANFPEEVAIKTIKPYSEVSYFKSLLSEIKVMIYLGKHENIVQLIGAYTANIKERILYMVVELSPYGNLENYLRFHQKEFNNLIRNDRIIARTSLVRDLYANLIVQNRASSTSGLSGTGQELPTQQGLSTAELVDWAMQIANGMTHLEAKKVIHADLATRNILLYQNGVVKITDFGLSRQLYAYTNYLKKEQEPLPWRWMALESLREMSFSTRSDIWGYGVTLWEMFSLGAVPYPGLSWSIDFVEKLTNGLRLSKPFYSTTEIYEIMVQCWHTDADQRPSFSELKNLFEGIKIRMMDPNHTK